MSTRLCVLVCSTTCLRACVWGNIHRVSVHMRACVCTTIYNLQLQSRPHLFCHDGLAELEMVSLHDGGAVEFGQRGATPTGGVRRGLEEKQT